VTAAVCGGRRTPTVTGDVPSARRSLAMAAADGRVWVHGGTDGVRHFDDLWTLDPVALVWSRVDTIGPVPAQRRSHSLLPVGTRSLLLFGGYDGGKFLNDCFVLDLPTCTWHEWRPQGRQPCPRSMHSLCVVDRNSLVLFGGVHKGQALGDVQVLHNAALREGEYLRKRHRATVAELLRAREAEAASAAAAAAAAAEGAVVRDAVKAVESKAKEWANKAVDLQHAQREMAAKLKAERQKSKAEAAKSEMLKTRAEAASTAAIQARKLAKEAETKAAVAFSNSRKEAERSQRRYEAVAGHAKSLAAEVAKHAAAAAASEAARAAAEAEAAAAAVEMATLRTAVTATKAAEAAAQEAVQAAHKAAANAAAEAAATVAASNLDKLKADLTALVGQPPAAVVSAMPSESSPSPRRKAAAPRSPSPPPVRLPDSTEAEAAAAAKTAEAAAAEARQQLKAAAAREKALQREVLVAQSKAAAAEAEGREERMLREQAEALRDDALAFAKETERRALQALQTDAFAPEAGSGERESAPERWEREAAAVVATARGVEPLQALHLGAHANTSELSPQLKRIMMQGTQ